MGVLDWLLRPFRGRAAEPEPPQVAPEAPVAGMVRAEKVRAEKVRAEKKARAERPAVEAPAKPAKAPKAARGEKPKGSKKKKARKGGAPAAAAPARDPRSEVLTVEEAERRYRAMLDAKPARPEERAAAGEAAAGEERIAPAEPERASGRQERPRDPAEEARRAEAAENRRRARIPQYQALIARADMLLAVADVEPGHLRLARNQLVDGWRALGAPPAEEAEALNAARDARIAAFDERAAAGFAVVDEARKLNLAARQAIVEEARQLAEREDLRGAGPAMGELRAKLRAAGPVSPADAEAVIAAFAAAEARLRERQEQVRAEREGARQEQLERLERLVKTAEALVTARDPEAAAERVKHLQGEWKTVRVPGPRGETDALWTRFRAACDAVFARRAEARVEASKVALERMEAIVVRAEGLAEAGMDGDPEDTIHKLLNDWKRAGRAPLQARDALWERLQAAFDHLRSPPVDLPEGQDEEALSFNPFRGLAGRDDEPA